MAPGGCAQAARPHRAVPGCGTPRVAPAPAPPEGCGAAPPPSIHYANEAARPRPPGKKTALRLPFTGSELLREARHLLQFPTRGQQAPQGTNRKAALGRANSRPPKAAAPASPRKRGWRRPHGSRHSYSSPVQNRSTKFSALEARTNSYTVYEAILLVIQILGHTQATPGGS